jgi:hypothetical protein
MLAFTKKEIDMAEAMPGVAGIPPEMPAQAPTAPAEMTPENLAAFEQMRQEIPSSEFSEDLLSTASEADPIAVAEFKAELRDLNLPPEVLDVLNQMVDEVLSSPEQYAEIRAKYMAQDIPEDLLPPVFDPEFFGALNIAIDEIRATGGMGLPPQGFANGGLATLNPIAAAMAQEGRYGDTMLAHISPREAQVLRRMGGSGTINPVTGLPEFFIKKLFKGVGKALKKVGSAVKKFVGSKIGKIVTTLALSFFLGPAAASALGVTSAAGVAAVSGFVGSAGSTALAGGSLKESLKAGAIGGIIGGAGAGVIGGSEAFQAGSYTGPTTVSGQLQKARDFLVGPQEAALPDPTQAATETVSGVQEAAVSPGLPATGDTGAGIVRTDITMPQPQIPGGIETLGTETVTPPDAFKFYEAGRGAASVPPAQAPKSLVQQGLDKILPERIQATAEAASGEAFKPAYDQMYRSVVGTVGEEQARVLATEAGKNAMAAAAKVGPLAKYGPLAATGLGVMALSGGFKQRDPEIPAGFEGIMGAPGMDLLRQYPEIYGLRSPGVFTTATPQAFNPYSFAPPAPVGAANGGSMEKFVPMDGAINGPGTEKSDDIPAMLSDGEFVFTARAVRGMGDGSRRKGAKRMYAMMKRMENRVDG